MSFRDELNAVIKKKALGFSYTEETIECETSRPKSFVLCESESRLYAKNGYLKVKKQIKNGEVMALEFENNKKFVQNNKILNRLKSFKIKGL